MRDKLTEVIIASAIEVHRSLGPGLLESTYSECLAYELKVNSIPYEKEKALEVNYKGVQIDCSYRLDFVIANQVILELKSVKSLTEIHQAQLLTYMKLAKIRTALLINFNVTKLVNGIKRFVL